MKRLSHLMMKKWRETERWKERRRSEPCGGTTVVEEEKRSTRVAESAARDTGKMTPRRRSEPCGQVAEEEEERPKMKDRRRRKSEPSVRLGERVWRTMPTDRWTGDEEEKKKKGRRRRKSESGLPAAEGWEDEDRGGGGQQGETDAWADRQALRQRSERGWPPVHQLPPLSDRKRKELLDRRMGRKAGRMTDRKQEVTEGPTDRKREEPNGHDDRKPLHRKLYRRKSEPGPTGVSEYNNQVFFILE